MRDNMRFERIKAYFIDLLVILVIYSFVNYLLPQSDNYKKYKAEENELQEKFYHQEISTSEYSEQYEIIYYKVNSERKVSSACYLVLLLLCFKTCWLLFQKCQVLVYFFLPCYRGVINFIYCFYLDRDRILH